MLGTRGRFAVPKGKKGKIRFYITVSKAQLLKAPFSTEGGSRVAETRLRVWYTPKGSKEALSVRDGRIKVSIARIKSGRAARPQRHPLGTQGARDRTRAGARAYPGEP